MSRGRLGRVRWGDASKALLLTLPLVTTVAATGCRNAGYAPGYLPALTGGTGGAAAGASGQLAGATGVTGGSAGSTATLPSGFEESAVVFDQESLLEVHVTIAPEDLEHIEEYGNDEVYRPAEARVVGDGLDESFPLVGFRHKGAWTLDHCWETGSRSYDDECARISYKLKFNEYVTDARLFGLKRLNLHAMSNDGTKLRERLAYSVFNDFGVPAARTRHAILSINGQPSGLFLAVEQIDGRFTAFRYPMSGNGNLYKEIWPHPDIDEQHFLEHLRTNDDPEDHPDVSDMLSFAAAVGVATDADFRGVLGAWVDLGHMLRYLAVDRALRNWDGITAFYSPYTPHNFYWYHDIAPGGVFHLIPWDLDNTLWAFDPFMDPQEWVTADPVPDWNVYPSSCDPMPVWEPGSDVFITPPACDRLLRLISSNLWPEFQATGQELLAGPLAYSEMSAKITRWAVQIEDAVADDSLVDSAGWSWEVEEFFSILQGAVYDFEQHLTEGCSVQEPEEVSPEPPLEVLNAPTSEAGLRLDLINNFEFERGATQAEPPESFGAAESATTFALEWNTVDPISGAADFRLGFDFNRIVGAWDEWVMAGLGTEGWQEVSLSSFTEISVTMRCDRAREVRVRLSSPVYDESWGGVWSEFGSDFFVSTEPEVFKVALDRIYYPDWAKDAWEAGQGFGYADAQAREEVIQRFNGLIFVPHATTDSAGEMLDAVEPGFLQVDNVCAGRYGLGRCSPGMGLTLQRYAS